MEGAQYAGRLYDCKEERGKRKFRCDRLILFLHSVWHPIPFLASLGTLEFDILYDPENCTLDCTILRAKVMMAIWQSAPKTTALLQMDDAF